VNFWRLFFKCAQIIWALFSEKNGPKGCKMRQNGEIPHNLVTLAMYVLQASFAAKIWIGKNGRRTKHIFRRLVWRAKRRGENFVRIELSYRTKGMRSRQEVVSQDSNIVRSNVPMLCRGSGSV
jgi:hypothetical protein